MDFEFRLPPEWTSRLAPDGQSYEFWLLDDPTHRFALTKLALQVYGDDPVQLVKIINIQMEMLEASKAARTARPMGSSLPSYTAPAPFKQDIEKIRQVYKKPGISKMVGVPDDYFDTTIDLPLWIHPDWQRFVNWIWHKLRRQ